MTEPNIAARVALVCGIAATAIGAALVLMPEALPRFGRAPITDRLAPAPTLPAPERVEPVAAVAPRIDVARIGARGTLVSAGRAAPGAEVLLFSDGREIGRARADARGEWVILPEARIPPGAREFSLVAQSPGGEPIAAAETLVLVVPDSVLAEAAAGERPRVAAAAPLAVLLPPTGAQAAPRVLQEAAGPRPALGLDIVDYDEGGDMRFAGSAAAGATVRVYVGRQHAGDAVADKAGRWALTPLSQPRYGRHALRVDQLAANGTVTARIELPFQRDPTPQGESAMADGTLVVQPGASLWRIARKVYGRGTRFTVIFQANREQIRDPRLIYPGQVFQLPEAADPAPPQLDSSRSR